MAAEVIGWSCVNFWVDTGGTRWLGWYPVNSSFIFEVWEEVMTRSFRSGQNRLSNIRIKCLSFLHTLPQMLIFTEEAGSCWERSLGGRVVTSRPGGEPIRCRLQLSVWKNPFPVVKDLTEQIIVTDRRVLSGQEGRSSRGRACQTRFSLSWFQR